MSEYLAIKNADEQLLKSLEAFVQRQYGSVEECTETGSPIETMMYYALSIASQFHHSFYLSIEPQHKLADYRTDFLVTLICRPAPGVCPQCNRGFTHKCNNGVVKKHTYCSGVCLRKAKAGERPKPIAVVVECDGHEFHEKTKAQAKHDKKRDRFIQSKGFNVLRFTGSEIWNDAMKCAEEVVEFLMLKRDE